MARIYRTTDRLKVRIKDITVTISPLSADQKAEIQQYMLEYAKGDVKKATTGIKLSLKYAIKDIDGIEDMQGRKYTASMDKDGYLSDESIDDILNLELTEEIQDVCRSLIHGVPSKFSSGDIELLNQEGSDEKKT